MRYAALHPEAVKRLRDRADHGEVLHPIGRGPAGHDQARRIAVPVRQRLAVHLIGDERVRRRAPCRPVCS